MRCLLITGLFLFFGVNSLYGQIIISDTGLEIENHEEVQIVIEVLDQEALDIGLTEERIISRVNVRLRQVGLKPISKASDSPIESLYIKVSVYERVVYLELDFLRPVFYLVEDTTYTTVAKAYQETLMGTHGSDSEFIISGIDRLLDQFLSDYLDAND